MEAEQLIQHLKEEGSLETWCQKALTEDKEDVLSELYNEFLILSENSDMDNITSNFFELGMQAFDWEHLYDLLKDYNTG